MKRANKGLFISFEGGEGAGKTTLMNGLEKDLSERGFTLVRTREPGGAVLSEKIRELLLEKTTDPMSPRAETLLYLAARAQHVDQVILPALQAGKIVLCDRFHDSTRAYQAKARGLGSVIDILCTFSSEHLEPDLTFYLDVDPKAGLQRVGNSREKDRLEQEPLSFHEKVRKAYLELADKYSQRIFVIDALQSKEQVLQEALARILRAI